MKVIREAIKKTLMVNDQWPMVDFVVEHPKEESHGDYSSNVALILAKQIGKNPRELAEAIVKQCHSDTVSQIWERVEVAGAGFINFYLKKEFFLAETKKAIEPGYGKNETLKGKKIMVEYTDPNPFKEMHIGHLMSNTIGESLARLQEASGAEVRRACYQGDVGLHVAKAIWGWQRKMDQEGKTLADFKGRTLKVKANYLGQAYAYGATKYETDETAKSEMNAMNKVIYDKSDETIDELYQAGREWSLEYFESIYLRLGTKFDEYFFESEAGPVGLKVVEEGLAKKVLEIGDDGAVVYRGEKDGLHTRVFRNKLGLPTYEAKDLGLAKTKYERYKYDFSYNVTGNEITEYFKVVLRVMEQLYPDLRAKTTHMPHGMMRLTTGKMSSRTGKVVTGEGLLNELKVVVLTKMGGREIGDKDKVADMIAVGALKYSVLKQAIGGNIVYEPEKMTNLEGDTGPYLQYTFARCSSVLRKSQISNPPAGRAGSQILKLGALQSYEPCNTEELAILRWIYRYPEVVSEAGEKMAPHLLATYLFELAQRFNTFYNQHQIVGDEGRILLTSAVANVLKSGLGLLGIQAPEEM
ncbi:MAG: arginine--tRNA ligase [bacterium]